MDLKGRLLGNRYEIIEKIGSGGMATVYKAKCQVLNRYVAVKILRDEFTTDEEFIKRFEVEAQSAASMTHPNIVSVYDVGVEGNLHYIVMELIKGKTLKEIIIEEKGALPWKWSIKMAIQIASALETAHKNNIIHRDIKPHNIIITENGDAKVTDFGIAKAVSNSTITAFGTTIGSVHYFSPEHARGGFTDEKSDLYSLGVVMYEMLTGKVPFDADTPVSIALKHMQEEPREVIQVNPNIPKAVNDVIMKSLKKDATLRYQSAAAMLLDLRRALKEPTGNFVDNNDYQTDCPTQRISTIELEEEMANTRGTSKKNKKPNKFIVFIKKHKILSSIIGLFLLFALTLGGTIAIASARRPKEVAIPNLVGKTVEEVKQILADKKLNYIEQEPEYNTQYEAGKIVSQEPKFVEGRKIKENTAVKVVVSLGTEKTTVPKFVGEAKEDAENLAIDSKVKIEFVDEISETVEAGIIIKQEIEQGTEVNAGDTVKVYISIGNGKKKVVVSSVLYKEESVAKQTLEGLGLVVEVEYGKDEERGNGVVLKQNIASGETVDEGTTVVITVNKLAETKTGTVIVDVKSFTEFEEGKTETVIDPETEEEIEIEIEPKDVEVKIVVVVGDDKKPKTQKVKENVTDAKFEITGKGKVTIQVWIKEKAAKDFEWKKDVDMNFESTQEITIKK